MSNGIKEKINIGFLHSFTKEWMGGITYFNNLFIAMSKVHNPSLVPHVLPIVEDRAKLLLNNAQEMQPKRKKDFIYYLYKFFKKITRQHFDKKEYIYSIKNLDVISHTKIMKGKPSIYWIPDFQHIHLPKFFDEQEVHSRNKLFLDVAKSSDLVIVSSEDAYHDFCNFAPEYCHKARVLHFVAIPPEGIYTYLDKNAVAIQQKLHLPEKYFYVPNQFWAHKNHMIVLKALALLKQEGHDINVVFTGNTKDYRNPEHFVSLQRFIQENNLSENIKILGLVEHNEVFYLMRNSVAIINPSLFEGWSSTVEEAKSFGKNMILSNINVHKEQNPPDSVSFDPYNAAQLAEIMLQEWERRDSAPNIELEKEAQNNLEQRIFHFGKVYQQIILELVQ